jgi:hypothetical protein
MAFMRSFEGETVYACINIDDTPVGMYVDNGDGVDLISGEQYSLSSVTLPPHTCTIIKRL